MSFMLPAELPFRRIVARVIFLASLIGFQSFNQSYAQDSTWNNGSLNSTWDTTSNNWSGSTWTNGHGAIFDMFGGGTINMPGPISVNSVNFQEAGYTINGSGPMTFVNGTSTQTTGVVNVGTGLTATINVPIISTVGFQKIGQGVLELGGTGNSFTGQIPLTSNGNTMVDFMVGPIGAIPTTAPLSGTVRLLSASVMPATTRVGIANGYLDIGSNNVTISSLVFSNQNAPRAWDAVNNANNGVIGSGTLRVTGEIQVLGQTGGNAGNSIAANVDLGGGTQVVRVGVISSFGLSNALQFTGSLSNGSLKKSLGIGVTGVMGSIDGMALHGNNTYTGSTVLNSGTTVVTGTNASQSLTISGIAGPGGSLVRLQGANGSFLSATNINAYGAGTFEIDNTANNGFNPTTGQPLNNTPLILAAQNNNRINDNVAIELRDGLFNYRGAASTAATETFGSIDASGGHNSIRLTPGATGGTVELTGTGNLTLGSRSTLLIAAAGTGNVLGGNAKLKFNGTVPAADSTGIIRGMVAGAGGNFPSPADFVMYDATDGFKALTAYASDFSMPGFNVALTAATTAPTQTINALKTTGTFTTTIGAADTLTISSGMVLSASGTNTFSGGTLAFGNSPAMLFGGNTINSAMTGSDGLIHATGTLTLAGDMSGLTGTLTSNNNGTTNLNTGSFAGPIHMRMGTLTLGANQTGPGLGAITLGVSQNASDMFGGTPTLAWTTTVTQIDRDIIVNNGGTNFDGVLPDDSYIARIGPSNYTANRNFTGDITLHSDLAIFGGSATGTANTSSLVFTGDITGNGRILFRNGRAVFGAGSTWSNAGGMTIGATGNSVQASFFGTGTGSGNLVVTGSTTALMGELNYNNNNSFGNGSITLRGGSTGTTITATASSTINNQINLNNASPNVFVSVGSGIDAEWAGQITGSGSISKTGVGKWIVSNNTNNYSGTTTLNAGTLQIGNGGTTGVLGTGAVVNNAALVFNRSNNFTFANAISGSGTVTKNGAGKTTLTANNSYGGTTTVLQGTLIIDGVHSNGSTYTVNSGAGLGGNGQIANSAVNILRGGILTPGNEIGKLRIDQSLNLAGIYEWQIRSSQIADVVAVGTDLNISGAISINFLANFHFEKFDKFTLLAYQGTLNGGFVNNLEGWSINYTDKLPGVNGINQSGSWRYVTLTAMESSQRLIRMSDNYRIDRFTSVPEPSSICLGLVSLMILAGKRSRKRSCALVA